MEEDIEPDFDSDAIRFEPMLQLFKYKHLVSPEMRDLSRQFCSLAYRVYYDVKDGPERTACLRKLREAKDCAITALLWVSS